MINDTFKHFAADWCQRNESVVRGIITPSFIVYWTKLAVSQSDGRLPVVNDSINITFSTGKISLAQFKEVYDQDHSFCLGDCIMLGVFHLM